MRTTFLAVLLLAMFAQAAAPETSRWRKLLPQAVDDEWQQIFGASLFQKHARPAETVAEKVLALQALIAKSNKEGRTIPVFLPPSLGLSRCKTIPASTRNAAGTRTGMPLNHVAAIEVFRYIANQLGYDVVETEHGLLFKPQGR